jgi:hypothetical protein
MKRWDIINNIIKKFKYNSYLEVGTQDPNSNFNKIDILEKVSIDPVPAGPVTFVGTSDEYFNSISSDTKFDIIFIDGLHHSNQVLKDIDNSLKHLNENGTIVCHDCLPTTERMQERYDHGGEWTGDVWKAIAQLRKESTNLDIKVVDTDYGCGIIRRGVNIPFEVYNDDYLAYEYFQFFKNDMMNVITINQFLEWINLP